MSVFVVSKFLLLLCDVDSNLDCLLHIANGSIQLEGPLGLLRLVINLAEEIVD